MRRQDAVLFWLLLAVYVLAMFGVGVAVGHLTAPTPPEIPARLVGIEPQP